MHELSQLGCLAPYSFFFIFFFLPGMKRTGRNPIFFLLRFCIKNFLYLHSVNLESFYIVAMIFSDIYFNYELLEFCDLYTLPQRARVKV